MSDCRWLSDRMPAVALGRGNWTAEEARHLSGCPSCQNEWELVRLASRLGEGMPALDAQAIADNVLERLEQTRIEGLRRRAWSFAGLAAAATLLAVIWTERPATRPSAPPVMPVVAGLQIPLPELDSLQPAELDSVLQMMDEPVVDGSTLDTTGLGDLDSVELQNVLDYWEG